MNDHKGQEIFARDATNHIDQHNSWENDSNFDIQDFILSEEPNSDLDNQRSPIEHDDLKKQKTLDFNRAFFANDVDLSYEGLDNITPFHPPSYDPYYHMDNAYPNMQVPSTSVDTNMYSDAPVPYVSHSNRQVAVKAEPRYEEDLYHGVVPTAHTNFGGRFSDGRVSAMSSVGGLNPEAIQKRVRQASSKPPRKYQLKPVEEKANPVYKEKRAKNNDAVRRSRIKAKAIAQEKEEHVLNLENRTRALEEQLEQYKAHCKCNLNHRLFKVEM